MPTLTLNDGDTATLAFTPWDDGGAMPPFTIIRKP
jgi:hypothetical protein